MLIEKAARPFGLQNEAELCSYFADIFRDAKPADGAVCIFSDKNNRNNTSYVRACEMYLRGPKEISRHDKRDTMFTFSSFRESSEMAHSIAKMSNVFAWSVDVDYKRKDLAPEDVLQYILDSVSIPAPNYAECGHRLRLIYLLDEPLRLVPGKKAALLRGFSFMQKCIADLINDAVEWAGAESCPVNSFFRIPGSINTKTKDVVRLFHISDERWTMQEIFSEWIPDMMIDKSGCASEWRHVWKEKKKSGKKSWNQYMLWEKRARKFENLRGNPDIPREKLCFLYGVSCLQTGKALSSEEAVEQILTFNRGFQEPLLEKEIRSKFRTIRSYIFKEETIADFLGIEQDVLFDRKNYDAFRYQKKRNEQKKLGYTKEQSLHQRRCQVFSLTTKKMRPAFIANALGISISTLKRDILYIKNHESEFKHTAEANIVKKEDKHESYINSSKLLVSKETLSSSPLEEYSPLALPLTRDVEIRNHLNQSSCPAAAFSALLPSCASCVPKTDTSCSTETETERITGEWTQTSASETAMRNECVNATKIYFYIQLKKNEPSEIKNQVFSEKIKQNIFTERDFYICQKNVMNDMHFAFIKRIGSYLFDQKAWDYL